MLTDKEKPKVKAGIYWIWKEIECPACHKLIRIEWQIKVEADIELEDRHRFSAVCAHCANRLSIPYASVGFVNMDGLNVDWWEKK